MSAAARRLGGLRNRLGAGFDQKCTITTQTKVSNGAGGWMDGPPTVLTDIDCQVRFPNSSPQPMPGQQAETSLARAEIRIPVGTAVSIDSRITVGSSAFDVQGHDIGRSYATEIVCACVRVGDGS